MRSCAEFFSDYELTLLARETLSPEKQQIRDELWLTRNSKNRLCADSTNQEIPYTKYRDFKKIIKKTLPPYTLEDVHTIGPDYSKHEFAMDMKGYARGTAVQEDGGHTIAFGPKCPVRYNTVEECLPVIRLIRLGNSKPAPRIDEQPIEDWVELREFSLSADMDTQMKEKLDFPEDWNDYLKELNEFQQIYTDIRKDPGVFASYRFFNAMGGVVCLQDHLPKGFKGNGEWEDGGEEGSIIPGYALTSPLKPPYIVLVNNLSDKKETLQHELYHQVDLRRGIVYSKQDILKYGLLVAQMDPDLARELKNCFLLVEGGYPIKEFEKEFLAQIMENPEKSLKNPITAELYKIGTKLSEAKVDDIPAISNRIKTALRGMPCLNELSTRYDGYKQLQNDWKEWGKKNIEGGKVFSAYFQIYERRAQDLDTPPNFDNLSGKEKVQDIPCKQTPPDRTYTTAELQEAFLERLQGLNNVLDSLFKDPHGAGKEVLSPDLLNARSLGAISVEETVSGIRKRQQQSRDESYGSAQQFHSNALNMAAGVEKEITSLDEGKFLSALVHAQELYKLTGEKLPPQIDLEQLVEADIIGKTPRDLFASVSTVALLGQQVREEFAKSFPDYSLLSPINLEERKDFYTLLPEVLPFVPTGLSDLQFGALLGETGNSWDIREIDITKFKNFYNGLKQAQEKGPFENNQSIVASICVAQQLFKQQCPEQEIPKHLRFESLYPLDIKYCMGDTKKMLNGWKQVFEERGLSTKFNENGHSRKTENPVQSPKRQDSLNSSTGPNTLLPILHKNGGKGF